VLALALAGVTCGAVAAIAAQQPAATKVVRYLGFWVRIPRSWPVYDLSRSPTACVRFNRHALYLGVPGTEQRCPAHAAGRTEAILLEPLEFGLRARANVAGPGAGELALARQRLLVTASWHADPGLIQRILGVRSLAALKPAPRPRISAHRVVRAHVAQGGAVYTGLGFDACAAPSAATMSAWGASPYRAIGVYIGGQNMACSQANLTSSWVSTETGAGWHLIPTYVGLQAPSNSCGCAAITPSQAQAEGTAAATDAVTQAQALGIGAGNPIYFDMEAYSTGGRNTPSVLTFLSAWTTQLHASGYESGVYSSSGSGISDLVSQYGTSYQEPDDLWIANWNGNQSTSDPAVPSGEWANHQRLHQYQGAHNERYGGVTINIDGDYLDGATVGSGGLPPTPLINTAPPAIAGLTQVRQTLSAYPGQWSSAAAISYAYRWQRCSPRCVNIPGATGQTYRLAVADIASHLRAVVTASNGSTSARLTTAEVGPIAPIGYWLYTALGNVYTSSGNGKFGSPAARGDRVSSIVGMAATPDGGGYWVVDGPGRVWPFGDAPRLGWSRHPQPIKGIIADPAGGYWLFTSSGNVYPGGGAGRFGSPAGRHLQVHTIVGMAATPDGRGYWLADASGRVWSFGDAARLGWARRSRPIVGIVADRAGGYWLFTAFGNVYPSAGGGRFFGSPVAQGARLHTIVGMAATPDGGGYWLVGASGRVWGFGDAAAFAPLRHTSPIIGIAAG
jgi:hypothetical protein